MRPVPPADTAFAALLTVTAVLETVLTDVGSPAPVATTALGLAAAAALLVRTRHPIACLATTVALVLVAQVPGTGLVLTGALVVACLLALGSVGRHCRDSVSAAGVTAAVTVFVVGAAFSGRPWDVVVALLACGAAWTAGRVLRREAQRSARLGGLVAELDAQREVLALEAVASERLRVARELHDTVAHTVSVMTLQVGGVRRRLDGDPGTGAERDVLLDVERLGREAVTELHRVLEALRAPDEDVSGERASSSVRPHPRLADLEPLVARVRAAGVPVDLAVEGRARALPAGLELAGYRVVQEALTNVLKHSPGAAVRVRICHTDQALEISVCDDGRPGGAAPSGRTGHGLAGVRERVALYGGHVDTGQTPAGFQVRATLPTMTAGTA